jgi:transposase
MTQEERIAQLEQENAELRAQLTAAYQQISQLAERLQRVEGQLAKDSHNSSKPPSSDGPARRPRSQRHRGDKPTGGQPGHTGGTLMQMASPDAVVRHRPVVCVHCQQPLEGIAGQLKERRQVYDLPEVRLLVREHQVEEVCCPICQQVSRGSFPEGVEAPVQYGPKVRALAVYLHDYQLVPLARVSELLTDLCACEVSEGAVLTWVECAAERLAPTVARIADWLSVSPLQHADETGLRIAGKRHWLHVNSTRFLTHLAWHARRGRKALEDIGIWPRFRGRAMRDRWASYDHYPCAHSICGAHVVRDCVYVSEQEQQEWAAELADLLLSMAAAAAEWRKLGAQAVPADERDAWIAQYFDLVASGFAAQPLPSAEDVPKRGGRRKQSAAKNLLDELVRRAEQVLAFLDDLSIPFTNNQAERDLRMVKVQQKIAGTFRSEEGATAFCHIRSYLSTMRKQGHPMLAALAAVFAGHPLPIAWAPM